MILTGDINKILEKINPVFEHAFARIEALEAEVKGLKEALEETKNTPKATTVRKNTTKE